MENIAKRRPEIDTAIQRARLPKDLTGGTPAMQEGGYIRKGSAETSTDYQIRVTDAYLFNGYTRTRGYLTGQVFRKDITITEDSELKGLFVRMKNDIDLQGNNMRTFAQEFFQNGLDEGVRFLLVQYPSIKMDGDNYYDEDLGEWRRRTKKADEENGWRPYFVQFGLDQLLGYRFEYQNGVKVLTQLRIMENITQHGVIDVEDEEIEQVRVIERGKWTTYRKADKEKETWTAHGEGTTSIEDIPLAIWMPGDIITDMTAIPALEDLAMLNKRHFVATADQNVLMSFVRRPPWFGKNLVEQGESVQFGPGRMVHSTSPDAVLQSVGVDVSSVEAGRGELKDLEERMGIYGLMMLVPTLRASGGKTATQAQQESTESVSQLTDWALSLKDCFDNALKFAAMYEDIEIGDEPELKINTEFQPGMGLEPQILVQAVEKGIIPKQVAFDEFKRRGLVSDVYDWEDVKAMIEDDTRSMPGPEGIPGLADMMGG